MKKTLLSLAFGAASLFGGCASTPEQPSTQAPATTATERPVLPVYSTEGVLSGSRTGIISSEDSRYSLEKITIGEETYIVHSNDYPADNELPFRLRKDKETKYIISSDKNSLTLESDQTYIPVRSLADGSTSDLANRVKTNVPAIRKNRDIRDPIQVDTFTQEDIQYVLPTITINEKGDFYVAERTTSATAGTPADTTTTKKTYLIPVAGASITIDTDSKIELRNPGEIYELKAITETIYAERIKAAEEKEKEARIPVEATEVAK